MHAVLALLVVLVLPLAACGGTTSNSVPAARPEGRGDGSRFASRVDIDAIFPSGPGRDLVLNNCQNCHTFVPIVVLQMDENAWQRNSIEHRERVTNLTDEQFRIAYEYLAATFGPHRPVPELPKELLESWTSY